MGVSVRRDSVLGVGSEEAGQDDDWRENYMTLEMMMQDKYEKGRGE